MDNVCVFSILYNCTVTNELKLILFAHKDYNMASKISEQFISSIEDPNRLAPRFHDPNFRRNYEGEFASDKVNSDMVIRGMKPRHIYTNEIPPNKHITISNHQQSVSDSNSGFSDKDAYILSWVLCYVTACGFMTLFSINGSYSIKNIVEIALLPVKKFVIGWKSGDWVEFISLSIVYFLVVMVFRFFMVTQRKLNPIISLSFIVIFLAIPVYSHYN